MPQGAKTCPLYLVSTPKIMIVIVIFIGIAIKKYDQSQTVSILS